MWGRLAEFCVGIPLLIETTFGGDNSAIQVTEQKKKIAVYFCELRGKSWKNVINGCLAMSQGTTEKSFRVPVGIEPTISVTPDGCSNYWAASTLGELRSLNWLGSSHKLSWVHSV